MSALLTEQEQQQQNQFWEEEAAANAAAYEQQQQYEEYYEGAEGYGEGYYQEDGNGKYLFIDCFSWRFLKEIFLLLSLVASDGEEWTQYYDENGYVYYYNNYTGQSQYENPYEAY